MDSNLLKKINVSLIILILFGLILISPWVIMWFTFLSSGKINLTDLFKYASIVLFRDLFIVGWILVAVGVLLIILVNFLNIYYQKIE